MVVKKVDFFLGNLDVSVNQISVMSGEGSLQCNGPVRTMQKGDFSLFFLKQNSLLHRKLGIFLVPIISGFYVSEYS